MSLFLQMLRAYAREFRLVLHDEGIIIFFLFLPLAYPVIYSLIYNPELVRDVQVVVVDHDRTALSRELVRKMGATQEVYIQGYASDLNEARRAMNEGKCYGILEIPEGFARKVGRGESSPTVLYCEMSLLLRYRSLLVASTNVALEMGSELQMEKIDTAVPLAGTLMTGDPMPISSVAMGNIESGFCSFIMPAVVVLILHQCLLLAIGMRGGAKHEDPRRIGYNPYNTEPSVLMTMIGQMLCYLTIMLLPMIYIVHYVPLMFSFPMNGNIWEIMLFLLPMMIACVGLGFCVQAIMWEREAVFVVWVVTSVILLFLSGITWPRFAMSPFWKALSAACPSTWGVEGYVKMSSNGATLAQVGYCYRNLWILAGVYGLLGYLVQKFYIRPMEKVESAKYAEYI